MKVKRGIMAKEKTEIVRYKRGRKTGARKEDRMR
jgi:hypothetical protein